MDKGRKVCDNGIPLLEPSERQLLCGAEGGSSAMLAFTLAILRHKGLNGRGVDLIDSFEKKSKLRLIKGGQAGNERQHEVGL